MKIKKRITVVGSGYVGMSLSVLLAQHNDVVVHDIDPKRVDLVNENKSTVDDFDIDQFLQKKSLSLTATHDKQKAYEQADFIIIATPTNYDVKTKYFDTSSVDAVVTDALKINTSAIVIIKSTLPVGHTKLLQERFNSNRIIFSPEFLREGMALWDNLHPSRIIIGSQCSAGEHFANILCQAAEKDNIDVLFMQSSEAEAVKLFANTYLAMRVAFFNELDSYALVKNLDTKSIVDGVCLDHRIGQGYNNPSFGYGGYCLPKDTKQLLANYDKIPQSLIQSIVESNSLRKDFISDEIIKKKPKIVGFHRLVMKEGSDNFRSSAIQGVMSRVKAKGIKIIIYEPNITDKKFFESDVVNDICKFKSMSDLIVSNRVSSDLDDVSDIIFSRDIFGVDT